MRRSNELISRILIPVALSALALVMARCAPIVASVAKQGGAGSLPSPASEGVNPRPRIVSFSVRVIEKDQNPDTDGPPGVTIGFTRPQVDAFKDSGKANLAIPATVTGYSVTAVFKLTLTHSEIEGSGLLENPLAILDINPDGGLTLSFADDLPSEQSRLLRESLVGVELQVSQATE